MMRQKIPVLIGIEARDRLEIIVRIDIEEHIAVVQIANSRRRKLLRVLPRSPGRGDREQGDGGHEDERAHRRPARQAYSQSLISNPGCWRRCRSLIFSSRYFAPMPFSNLTVAPR